MNVFPTECPLTPAGGHLSWPYCEPPVDRSVSDILAVGTNTHLKQRMMNESDLISNTVMFHMLHT